MIPWVSLNFWMREWRFLLGHECFFPLSTHRGETRKNNGCIERLIIKSDCIIWKILKSYNSINWGWTYYSTTGFFFPPLPCSQPPPASWMVYLHFFVSYSMLKLQPLQSRSCLFPLSYYRCIQAPAQHSSGEEFGVRTTIWIITKAKRDLYLVNSVCTGLYRN